MKEKPIIFSGAMVRAILDGRKTQTRRVAKLPENAREVKYWTTPTGRSQPGWADPGVNYWTPDQSGETSSNHIDPCPYGQPGDRLWVRETHYVWKAGDQDGTGRVIYYRSTDPEAPTTWTPSIHMPRWASRILLEITNVRVERVQEISQRDVFAEGIKNSDMLEIESAQQAFYRLWDSINAARGYGWDVNPWVWVIEFRRIE